MFPPLFTDPSLSLSLHFSTLFALSHLSHDNVVSSSFRRIYVDILYLVCTYLDKFGEIASCAKLASKTRYGGGARLLSYSPKKRVSPPLNGTISFAEHHHRQNSFFVQFHSSTPLPKREWTSKGWNRRRGGWDQRGSTRKGEFRGFVGDIARHSRRETFPKGPNKARHARIGEKKVGQSIRYRRFEREVGEPISKKRRELFFYREEKRDLRSATSSNRRYSMTLLVKSLNRRLNNRYSALRKRCISFDASSFR